jgi:Bacterial regulatory helix-turn-helix protein, lysR family
MSGLDGLAAAVRQTRHEPATRVQRSRRDPMDWNDVRVFLAVAREGLMRGAGRALGLSEPTIARRLRG